MTANDPQIPAPRHPAPGATARALPYRHIWRSVAEFHFTSYRYLIDVVPNEYLRSVVFLFVARLSTFDWADAERIAPPAAITRRGRIGAIAASLGRPFETVRRHVWALAEAGLCSVDEDGVALATGSSREAEILAFLERSHDVYLRMAEHLTMVEIERMTPACGPAGPAARPLVGETLLRALDTRLSPHERIGPLFAKWHTHAVWSAITAANARPIMIDPVLSRRHAYVPTPDALRHPVSLQSVAAALGFPYATVWRHAQELAALGVVGRRDGGWMVANGNLADPRIEPRLIDDAHFTVRKIRELVRAGLDPKDLGSRYIRGRPPLDDFYPGSTGE